jgi:hypothetical protein
LPEKILTSKEEKRVLQTAAVIGTDVPFTLLQALAHLPEPGDTRMLALELSLALERALRPLGEFGRNLALLGKAEALARALDDRTRLGWVLAQMATVLRITGDHGLGRLYGQTCRAEPGRAALTAAIDLYRAMNMTFWLPQTEAALAQVEGR